MNPKRAWMTRSVLLAIAAAAAIAIVTGMMAAAPQAGEPNGGATVTGADGGAAPDTTGDAAEGTDAACRRAPECSVDSDCDAICGVGLGHCVHSNCPVRICKCK